MTWSSTPQKAQAFAERGVEVRHGDYDDESTLGAAFTDAQTLLFVSSSEVTPGLPYTFLRNTFYTEQFVDEGLTAAVDAGELIAPAIEHPLATATIDDLAVAAGAVLTGDMAFVTPLLRQAEFGPPRRSRARLGARGHRTCP